MGTTPIYGFPYPDPSDLVANYPALGQQLAEDVETAIAASGKVLQIVRATDATDRTTTSTTKVDVTGMSVTITPQKIDSSIIVMAVCSIRASQNAATSAFARFYLTDSGGTSLSGGESDATGYTSASANLIFSQQATFVAYDAPATLSATTYKMMFAAASAGNTASVRNGQQTGQMYAIEVSA